HPDIHLDLHAREGQPRRDLFIADNRRLGSQVGHREIEAARALASRLQHFCLGADKMAQIRTKKTVPIEDPDIFPDLQEQDELGPETAGQSGDTQGLSHTPQANSQSVEELVAEGQSFEAGVISGVENAPPADLAEVKTKEVPEDDVPPEYLDQDQERPYNP